MSANTPSLVAFVDESIGAFLVSCGVNLLNLARQQGNKCEMLGAEKVSLLHVTWKCYASFLFLVFLCHQNILIIKSHDKA